MSGSKRLGILKKVSHRGFSANPASLPLCLLPLADPALTTALAEDFESFRPAEPLLPLPFFEPVSWPGQKEQQQLRQQRGGT